MRLFTRILAIFIMISNPIWANEFIPDRHVAVTRDVDFYGSDLQSIFDTTLSACEKACLADAKCEAFTFNSRSNSCFTKSNVLESQPYIGATSARVVEASPQVLLTATLRAAELTFLRELDFKNAKDFAQDVGQLYDTKDRDAAELWKSANNNLTGGSPGVALKEFGAVMALTDLSKAWVSYADLSMRFDHPVNSNRATYRSRGMLAAINAYLRSKDDSQRMEALQLLAKGLETAERHKEYLRALHLAESISPTDDVVSRLNAAIMKYSIRMVDHEVESDLAEPRICARFSEPLATGGVDFEPYVRVAQSGLSVEAEGNKLCITGIEHGERYDITLREGLPAASGEALLKPVQLSIYVGNRKPSASFAGRSYVLPKTADAGIPVETINVSELELVLRRVSDRNLLRAMQDGYFGRSLSPWQVESFSQNVAEEIWRGTGEVQSTLNQVVTTRLPMGEIINDLPPGIYALQAGIPDADRYDNPPATQWFVLTDLGLATMSGADGIHVFVRGLGDAEPRAGIKVALLSKANVILAETTTDARGYAQFSDALARGTGGARPALITAQNGDVDMAFLSLIDPEFDLSDRGVEGREPAKHIDIFLTTDRGAYHAGDIINATVLTRDATVNAIGGLPITAILTRPDGVEYSRHFSSGDDAVAGGHIFKMPTGPLVPRGTWRLAMYADPDASALASTTFLIEDFLPERIDFDLSLPDTPLRLKTGAVLTADTKYLFGAPATNLPIEGEVVVRATNGLPAYPGYSFGRYNERFNPEVETLPDGLRTDENGQVNIPVNFPDVESVTRPLEALFTVRISEGSGRPVERRITQRLAPDGPMIGIKPLFDDVVGEGTRAEFQIIAIDEDEVQTDMDVEWTVNRIRKRYQWYRQNGNWNWESIDTRKRVASGHATLSGDPITVNADVDWGEYEIIVTRKGAAQNASSFAFYAGWYVPADVSSTPDTLDVSLDKPMYATGETATLRVVPRYAGKALITVMSNRLIEMKVVDVVEGENVIPLTVTDEWGAGAYVTATVIRPMNVAAGHNPARALGLSYATVDPAERKLTATFEMSGQSAPRAPMDVVLRVDGMSADKATYVTIAAVDVGILNLTGFDAPDAPAHYFGQRKLGMGMRDVYGRLIDGMNGAMGAIRSGGDAGRDEMSRQSPPPTEELVAYFSGPLKVGDDGIVRTSFDMPEFNGTVRLMAVVWSDKGVGAAQTDVLVRDPVVITASLPRFLAPDDTSRMLLEITHATGPSGQMQIEVAGGDGVVVNTSAVPRQFTLGDLQKTTLSVPISAVSVGVSNVTVVLTTPDGKRLTKTLVVPVVANDPEVSHTFRFDLAAGDTFTLDENVFSEFKRGTGSAMLSVGPLARFDAPGLLAALDRYPYGCTEQTTSRAMPLLYLNEVAEAMGLGSRTKIAQRVDGAIERVLSNQATNGAFGLWRPGSGDLWLDSYVTDFLSRAKAKGVTVPEHAFRMAVDNLRNRVNYYDDSFDEGGEDLAYALFVLAREGAAAMGDLRYYADEKGDSFASPLAAAQLGAALASYGDQPRADAMFTQAYRQMIRKIRTDERHVWRSDYGSDVRDGAAVLALAVEAGSDVINSRDLADWVARSYADDSYHSTQESMWSLMAVKALINDPSMEGFTINGAPATGPLVRVLSDNGLGSSTAIRNGTDSKEAVTMTTFGVPQNPEPAGGNGYAIERKYYSIDGEGISINPNNQPIGTRMIVVLKITPFNDSEGRLMVNDPLPAGFEIDNPNLISSGEVSGLDWLEITSNVRNSEFRSDRFLAAVDWRKDEPFNLAYNVRVISPGVFHHPAATVEDMYRPAFRAHTDTGQITVPE